MNTTPISFFNVKRDGYDLAGRTEFAKDHAGQDDFQGLIDATNVAARPARGLAFATFEDGRMSGATLRAPSALTLNFVTDWLIETHSEIIEAVKRLGWGCWAVTNTDRYGKKCLAIARPLDGPVNTLSYTRLAYVLREELQAAGCRVPWVEGTWVNTHLLHIAPGSEVAWIDGTTVNPALKKAATKSAAQNMDRDRFSVGRMAAQAQLGQPTLTACDPGLFEGL